jgi:hypothetical protein
MGLCTSGLRISVGTWTLWAELGITIPCRAKRDGGEASDLDKILFLVRRGFQEERRLWEGRGGGPRRGSRLRELEQPR